MKNFRKTAKAAVTWRIKFKKWWKMEKARIKMINYSDG